MLPCFQIIQQRALFAISLFLQAGWKFFENDKSKNFFHGLQDALRRLTFDYLSGFILLKADRAAVLSDYCEHLLFQPDQEDKDTWKWKIMGQAKDCGLHFPQFHKDLLDTWFSLCWKLKVAFQYTLSWLIHLRVWEVFFNQQSIRHKKVNPIHKSGLSLNWKTLSRMPI